MGYGLLAIGYIVSFILSINLYGWAIRLLGCVLMGVGLYKLRDYFPSYLLTFVSTCLLFALSAAEGVCDITLKLAGESEVWELAMTVVRYARDGAVFAFNILLIIPTFIALGHVGLKERRVSAVTDLCAVLLWGVLYILSRAGVVSSDIVFAVQLVVTVMIFVLLFGCYMRICPEGDEDMPRKPSKLPFVNKISDALEKKERESAERAARKLEEDRAKRSVGKKSKKRKKH